MSSSKPVTSASPAWLFCATVSLSTPLFPGVIQGAVEPQGGQGTQSAQKAELTNSEQRKPGDIQPEDAPMPGQLPEVLVAASDTRDVDSGAVPIDYAGGRDVIGPKEIQQAGAPTTQQLLRRTPGAQVSDETGSDSLPNISFRGVVGNDGPFRSVNVALLADGIPLVSAPYGQPGASLFPLVQERIYAIDIIRGGSSVRYGPNNVSGVVNFLTRPIPERMMLEQGFRADLFRNYSSYTAFGDSDDRFGYLAEVVYKDGETWRDNGDYVIQNYSMKSAYQMTQNQRGLLQVEYFDDDSQLSDGLSLAAYQADPGQTQSPQNRFDGQQTRYNYKHEIRLGADTQLDLVTYYYTGKRSFFLQNPIQVPAPNFIQATPRPSEVWAIGPELTHDYILDGDVTGQLFAGTRIHDENIRRSVLRTFPDQSITQISDDRFDYRAYTAFIENSFVIDRWKLTPGLRLEDVSLDAANQTGFAVERDFQEVLPAVNASYLIDDQWSAFGTVQRTYQPPGANVVEISSDPQDFNSQRAWMYEAGVRVQTADARTRADMTVYQIDYSERLEPDPDQFDVFLNSGRSRHQGIELAADQSLYRTVMDELIAFATVAYNRSEYKNGQFEGNDLPYTPDWLMSWGLRYDHKPSGIGGGIDGYFTDEAFSDRENTVAINAQGTRGLRPSYVVWNARLDWNRQLTKSCLLRTGLNAWNLFDNEYFDIRPARGIYPGAPFNLGLALSITWTF
jgi:Fe(3+) dicitrate transport protein